MSSERVIPISSSTERQGARRAMRAIASKPGGANQRSPAVVYFVRAELTAILGVYGRMVAAGQWRDYAIDQVSGEAIFSIHRRASEMPLFRIIKQPALANRQGMWRITGMDGRILKRGHDVKTVLSFFNGMLKRAENIA